MQFTHLKNPHDLKIFCLKYVILGCEEGAGLCAMLITIGSLLLIVASLPLSLFFVVKVVQVMSTNVADA